MYRKPLTILLTAALALSFSACGSTDNLAKEIAPEPVSAAATAEAPETPDVKAAEIADIPEEKAEPKAEKTAETLPEKAEEEKEKGRNGLI